MQLCRLLFIPCLAVGPCLRAQSSGADHSHDSGAVQALVRAVRDTILANGLDVISIENHAVPLTTVEVVVRTGAFTQDPGTEGVPHLFEHMLFRAFSGADGASFGESASELDAIHNGTTQDEQVSYYVTLPSAFLDRAIDLMAQLVRDPVFTQQMLDGERRVVLNEFDRDQSDPQYRLQLQVEQHLWTSGWGRKNALGEIQAINTATPKLLRDIYHRYYLPNNAALIVSGDIVPGDMFRMAARHFGGWARGPDPFVLHPIPPTPALSQSSSVVLEGDVQNATIRIEWQGPSASRDQADTYAADVLGSIIQSPASTFRHRLVDSGLLTAASVSYLTLGHVGPITLYASTPVDSLPRALDALADVLGTLDEPNAFNDVELADSKRARVVDAAFELDHPTGMAHTVGFWWSVLGLGYYMDYTTRLAASTRTDLQRYVRRYIRHAPAVVGVLLPRGQGAAAQATVTAFINRLSVPLAAPSGDRP
jgi:zinc protease